MTSPRTTAPSPSKSRTVALVGRANSGKTSLLMHLTGSLQRPVNFPGSSVECVESSVQVAGLELRVVDLPGIAALEAVSRDEQLALDVLHGTAGPRPDLLCVVCDASRLPVELPFLQQVRGLGLPIVVALTKLDVATAEGFPVAVDRLQQALGLPLAVVDGLRGKGAGELRALL
ncbi:MAG: FeoB small GTPase domain-containing protein, partial [Planctomycetota bacterium]